VHLSRIREFDVITYEVEKSLATITIDDPERRNPLASSEMDSLAAAVRRAGTDELVRVIVITGAGERAFSAGGDLRSGFVDEPLVGHQARGALVDLFSAMRRNPKPIVGRINGVALGGGFGVAAACDITIAVDHAKFGTPEIDLGLWPMMISTVLLPLVPRKLLLEMMMTGGIVSAEEAKDLGIVNAVVAAADLDGAVRETVDKLLSKSSAALALGKESFYAMADMDTDTALDHLHLGLTALARTEDAAEGVEAVLDKRDPEWRNR
jgi:enoyl-CoA hydratase/carnithine racemase